MALVTDVYRLFLQPLQVNALLKEQIRKFVNLAHVKLFVDLF